MRADPIDAILVVEGRWGMMRLRPRWLVRRRQRLQEERIRREIEAAAVTDVVDHELLEQDIDAYKEDVFVAGGDGTVSPALPIATPHELDEEFQHDEERPCDPTP